MAVAGPLRVVRRKGRRAAAAAVALAVTAAAAWWAATWRGGPARPGEGETARPAATPGLRTEGVHLVGRHRGERQWELDASRIETGPDGHDVRFAEVANGRFYRDGGVFLRFEGEGGRFHQPTGRLWLDGLFRLQDRDGNRLEARDLVWEPQAGQLESARPVRVEGRGFALQAARMTVDVPSGIARFTGGVVVRQDGLAVLSAPQVDWVVDTGELRLFGTPEARAPGAGGERADGGRGDAGG